PREVLMAATDAAHGGRRPHARLVPHGLFAYECGRRCRGGIILFLSPSLFARLDGRRTKGAAEGRRKLFHNSSGRYSWNRGGRRRYRYTNFGTQYGHSAVLRRITRL